METIGIWGTASAGGSGIGKAIIERLTADANTFIHVFGRSRTKIAKLCSEFAAIKGSLIWNLRDESKVDEYQRYLTENGVTTVICTVGVGIGNPILFLTQPELKEMLEANLISPFMILKYSALPLKQLHGGRIIMFGSIASMRAEEGACGYSATKMALRGLVEASRRELKDGFQSVSVHGVYAGSVSKVHMASVVEAVRYLCLLPYGVHADIIVN
jgi:NAD(P)-dependent dehydrogenase (short-subunit alcohol dehydrogenase family)